MRKFIEALDLTNITLVCQDWGGMLGLRVLAQIPQRFVRVVATHTDIPDGSGVTQSFRSWRNLSQQITELDVPRLLNATLRRTKLDESEAAAYAAPFPSAEYQMGALVFTAFSTHPPASPRCLRQSHRDRGAKKTPVAGNVAVGRQRPNFGDRRKPPAEYFQECCATCDDRWRGTFYSGRRRSRANQFKSRHGSFRPSRAQTGTRDIAAWSQIQNNIRSAAH